MWHMAKVGWLVFIAALLFCAYVCLDFKRFFSTCRQYSEHGYSHAFPWKVPGNEAIVVLAGDWGRIPKAVELLREHRSPLLIISGAGKGVSKTTLLNRQGDAALNIHETWEKILVESESGSTVGNAEKSAKLLSQRNIQNVILVTSEYHMPRALKVFEWVFPSVEYMAYPVSSKNSPFLFHFSQPWLDSFWKFFVEYWKYFHFRHFYWLFI